MAVIELKRGASATTGAVRTRNEDARELRSIFPFVGYFFLADQTDMEPHKFYRANKRFDSAIITNKTADRDWLQTHLLENAIRPHLEELRELDILQ